MGDFNEPIPLVIPGAAETEKQQVVEDFREVGVSVEIAGVYVVKAAGPFPDANFFIDLTRHAASYPFEHFIDMLEGVLGIKLLEGFARISKWLGRRVAVHFRLPVKRGAVQYIIPSPPADKAAVRAIKKHFKSLSAAHANEYFWEDGRWTSAEEHFAKPKR